MKERPILFSGPMVRAVLSGAKTQTRRVHQPPWAAPDSLEEALLQCRHGQPGDLLWVRETFAADRTSWYYRADGEIPGLTWTPSIFMPRAASRLTLRLTEVRVERVQDISQADAVAEGTQGKASFALLWDALNAKRGYGWASNPWVWVLSFEVVQ
jgi:hypothetical protein